MSEQSSYVERQQAEEERMKKALADISAQSRIVDPLVTARKVDVQTEALRQIARMLARSHDLSMAEKAQLFEILERLH